ncbi:DUF2058 domain-containing protein [Lysobacter solisilvae (ex Woo and Kim 2020)]|uniref:DUF2058 family protein n=1 Tax=Agrilutibacter terrestris TaxID=2865112 RepID=A0A7H0FXR7_9GAMM|nr:DUF2058 family protein [Lysobacter terrestris]QNP40833.1 DUF2058 family protein [Lysobacter terrestris]
MSDSLRDQLLGLGFKPAPKPERPQGKKPVTPQGKPQPGRRPHEAAGKPQQRPGHKPGAKPKPRGGEGMDLAKAYAIRAQHEKDERIAAEAARQEEARKRREARAKLTELVKDKGLNVADAEIARHFPYGGKIKRVYVTAEQLKALNAGELGVLQLDGRYLLVTAELVAQAADIFPQAIALRVDPNAPAEEDPYADPQYQVPDDLVW